MDNLSWRHGDLQGGGNIGGGETSGVDDQSGIGVVCTILASCIRINNSYLQALHFYKWLVFSAVRNVKSRRKQLVTIILGIKTCCPGGKTLAECRHFHQSSFPHLSTTSTGGQLSRPGTPLKVCSISRGLHTPSQFSAATAY